MLREDKIDEGTENMITKKITKTKSVQIGIFFLKTLFRGRVKILKQNFDLF